MYNSSTLSRVGCGGFVVMNLKWALRHPLFPLSSESQISTSKVWKTSHTFLNCNLIATTLRSANQIQLLSALIPIRTCTSTSTWTYFNSHVYEYHGPNLYCCLSSGVAPRSTWSTRDDVGGPSFSGSHVKTKLSENLETPYIKFQGSSEDGRSSSIQDAQSSFHTSVCYRRDSGNFITWAGWCLSTPWCEHCVRPSTGDDRWWRLHSYGEFKHPHSK